MFTVGEVEEDFAGVQQAPVLPVVSSDRWIVLMDGMIVNGKSYSGDSSLYVYVLFPSLLLFSTSPYLNSVALF